MRTSRMLLIMLVMLGLGGCPTNCSTSSGPGAYSVAVHPEFRAKFNEVSRARFEYGACCRDRELLTVIGIDIGRADRFRIESEDALRYTVLESRRQEYVTAKGTLTVGLPPPSLPADLSSDDSEAGYEVQPGELFFRHPPGVEDLGYFLLVWGTDCEAKRAQFELVGYEPQGRGPLIEARRTLHVIFSDCEIDSERPPPAPKSDVVVPLPTSIRNVNALITNAVPGGTGYAGGVLDPDGLTEGKFGVGRSAAITIGGSVDLLWPNSVIESIAVERTRDRSALAFTSRDTRFVGGEFADTNPDLFVADANTGEAYRLTTFRDEGKGVGWFAWSPDGTRIACNVTDGLGSFDVYLVDVATGVATMVAGPYSLAAGIVSGMTWSPTGDRLAYTIENMLHVLDLETGTDTEIFGIAFDPDWHPTDERILYTRDNALWSILADGTGITQILQGYDGILLPQWSPDASKIAMGYTAEGALDPMSIAIYDIATETLTVFDDTGYAFYIDW
ncbi:MAG: hypothetical protein QNJ90_00225 [Planctomycetota bacterium]|nr:hypothetical protein [Planctomycetota bacterium]